MTIALRRFAAALLLGLVGPLLGGCLTSGPATKPKPAPRVAVGTTDPLRFGGLSIGSMRRGMQMGRYVWDIDCGPPYDDVFWTSGVNMQRGSTFDGRFEEVMTDAGFDVVGRVGGPDSPDGNRGRARFTVQGDLRDVQLELCHRSNWLTGGDRGVSGTGSARVDWSVYDTRSHRLVLRVTTSGVSRQDRGVPQGDTLLIEEAFAAAAERLAADAGFRAALTRGGAVAARTVVASPAALSAALPAAGGASVAMPEAPGTRTGLLIQTIAADDGSAEDPTARVGAAQVRVGEGYGLVIGEIMGETGRESVLLASQVGGDETVVVRPARGVILTGTVMGRDAAGGPALIRVPARLTAVPVRGEAVRVSDPVSVALRHGAASATGIVGALRPDPQRGIAVIQADLGSLGLLGASVEAGDPLMDETGAVIGLALGPGGMSAATPAGLVAFLPVGPLLARLGAEVLEKPSRTRRPERRSGAGRDAVAREELGEELDGELDGDRDPPT